MTTSNLLALLLAASGLLATGCKQRTENEPSRAQTGERADNDRSADSGRSQKDYWTIVAPLMAGDYNGQCQRLPDVDRTPGTFLVSGDGQVTIGDFTETVRKCEIKLARTIHNGVMTNLIEASDGELRVQLIDAGATVTAAMTRQDKIVTCEKAREATGLRNQRLYPLFAEMVEGQTEQFKCYDPLVRDGAPLPFKFNDGELTLGGKTFDFDAAEQEIVNFSRGLSRVEYNGFLANKESVSFELDESGKLRRFAAGGGENKAFICELG